MTMNVIMHLNRQERKKEIIQSICLSLIHFLIIKLFKCFMLIIESDDVGIV